MESKIYQHLARHKDKLRLSPKALFEETNLSIEETILGEFDDALDILFSKEINEILSDDMGELELLNTQQLSKEVWKCLDEFSTGVNILFQYDPLNLDDAIIKNFQCGLLHKLCELHQHPEDLCARFFALVNRDKLREIYTEIVEFLKENVPLQLDENNCIEPLTDDFLCGELFDQIYDLTHGRQLLRLLEEDRGFSTFEIWDNYVNSYQIERSNNVWKEQKIQDNISYEEMAPEIRRGIRTIVEYYDTIQNPELDWPDEDGLESGILKLIEDTANGREDEICIIHNLTDKFFEKLGYSHRKAKILQKKLEELTFSAELDYKYITKILVEFDYVSCCLSDCEIYPKTMVESLCSISSLETHIHEFNPTSQKLKRHIWHILSLYRSYPLNSFYKHLLEDCEYDCTDYDFMDPENRKGNIEVMFDKDTMDFDRDPEVYGCSVDVKFPDGKIYKYNCSSDDISIDDIVYVTGIMKNIKGIVVERFEMWDAKNHIPRILKILN